MAKQTPSLHYTPSHWGPNHLVRVCFVIMTGKEKQQEEKHNWWPPRLVLLMPKNEGMKKLNG